MKTPPTVCVAAAVATVAAAAAAVIIMCPRAYKYTAVALLCVREISFALVHSLFILFGVNVCARSYICESYIYVDMCTIWKPTELAIRGDPLTQFFFSCISIVVGIIAVDLSSCDRFVYNPATFVAIAVSFAPISLMLWNRITISKLNPPFKLN